VRSIALRLKRGALVVLAAIERALFPRQHCFEAGCQARGTHAIRVTVRSEHGEQVEIMARVLVPAVLCSEHAHAEEPLLARDVMPKAHRQRIGWDLERRFGGVPVSWDRSTVEIRHRFWAWLLWRAS
jgi:hypothetical protein